MKSVEYFKSWPYPKALAWMHEAYERVARNSKHIIIGCGSHTGKVITFGRNCSVDEQESLKKIPYCEIYALDRGGGPTAHEYGQLVLYPLINLAENKLSVRDIISIGEQTMLKFAYFCGVKARLSSSLPGLFVGASKVGFIGMRIKNNISYHGLAINIFNDAEIFKSFRPCNIKNLSVGSLGHHARLEESLDYYAKELCQIFLGCL